MQSDNGRYSIELRTYIQTDTYIVARLGTICPVGATATYLGMLYLLDHDTKTQTER